MNDRMNNHPYLGVPKLVYRPTYQHSENQYNHQYCYYKCCIDDNRFVVHLLDEETIQNIPIAHIVRVNKCYPVCLHRPILYFSYSP